MSDPYIGEIRIFGGNFAPQGGAFCAGQLLSISQNTALFSILATTYGGNGTTNFALPDLRGRAAVGFGQGPGLSNYDLGQSTGSETVTLTAGQIAAHNHLVAANAATGTVLSPGGADLAQSDLARGGGAINTYSTPPMTKQVTLDPATVQPSGGSQPHANIQPVLTLNYIIALQGIYPPRS